MAVGPDALNVQAVAEALPPLSLTTLFTSVSFGFWSFVITQLVITPPPSTAKVWPPGKDVVQEEFCLL